MIHPLLCALEKPQRLVIGLMSGTSADGVDAALCCISGHGLDTRVEQLAFLFAPFTEEIRREILRLAGGSAASAGDFCRMNVLLGRLCRDAALALCRQQGVAPEQIDLIGSHGQTFWHIPVPEDYLGHRFASTLQLGEGSELAQAFGCPVITDFRVRDVAAGGQGAPLVPFSEFLIYRREDRCVALQNIGGIGNITCLPAGCRPEEVFAFDTGPGNMIIDALYAHITRGQHRYDAGGAYAATGAVDARLLAYMMDDPYLRRTPPKTTGREYYGPEYVQRLLARARELGVSEPDLMATATCFTAETIAYHVKHYFPAMPDELVVGGGGSMNKTMLRCLQAALPECRVVTNEALGFDSSAKEAVAFAVLANEALFAGCNNVPSVTGANGGVVMGKISL